MPNRDAVLWFKTHFQADITSAIQGTPYSLDLLTAVACQETGYIWDILRRHLPVSRVLELCVGDSLDDSSSPPRSAFPKNKAALVAEPNGQQMFNIARQALVEMAQYVPGYSSAVAKASKISHGFGIFQYDLQFFKTNPQYFLTKSWGDFKKCLSLCVTELKAAQSRAGFGNKQTLTDLEKCYVAIAYNKGSFNPAKGLQQGHKSGGKYYGEKVYEFLQLAQTVMVPQGALPQPASVPPPGSAALPAPTPIEATGPVHEVDVKDSPLMLRSEPVIDQNDRNVIAKLSDGTLVREVSAQKKNGFLEVETSIQGAHKRGWAYAKFLVPAGTAAVPTMVPAAVPPSAGIVAVYAPRSPSSVTKRTNGANAHSLNESGQPGRKGTTPAELCAEIGKIIDWLGVDKSSHVRYQPGGGKTYCNIYMHDFCHLAGVYLPRVWWTQASLVKLAQGQQVAPKLGNTIDEVRANDLCRWLKSFGPDFGWRQTGTLTKLQNEVNMGAVGLIVARRVVDGASGHIVAVVPETGTNQARRNAAGDVVAPLQSQAGSRNFRYGTGTTNWWLASQFAEFGFWLHP